MYGGNYYGSLVMAAGLVVTSAVVPPSSQCTGYGGVYYGAGVYGAGLVITTQTPVPPTPPTPDSQNSSGDSPRRTHRDDERARAEEAARAEQRITDDDEEILAILSVWINLK